MAFLNFNVALARRDYDSILRILRGESLTPAVNSPYNLRIDAEIVYS